ncbi:TetR/AcrR family transcriptional regulator [Nocardioides sp. QY071]|uniref:TetR/AcrR family transcriptional regulator n=1 Tax=Nocardioides sp. QY071 TaxID=3044187 RepID=UPI00249C66A0|nr:TetR/AcrR family transcriptional regulator [Nocardioides sp. QY071]WGY02885.1 TetR/AcrR family transcriptional regulator [Nocardioides sp. QY071]
MSTSTGTSAGTPAGPSPAARGDETRARLLAAAVTTFSAKGFHGTTTRDIARAAGISPTAMYVHHSSKEELLYLISRRGHEEALAVVREALGKGKDPATRLRAVVHDFAMYHARSHVMSRVVNYELAALSQDHLVEILLLRRAITEELRALVDDGIATGAFDPPDRRLAVAAVISLGVDIARWYRDDGVPPGKVATAYAEMVLRFMSGQ